MRILGIALAAVVAMAGTAHAGDKPLFGPVPAWVKPVAPAAAPAKADDAPMRMLLLDQQIAFEPGRQTLYSDYVMRIQNPQGLTAGNIAFSWRPETDDVTVHRLVIRRGKEVVDVLASGQTFTIARRETNMDSATLDGVLTANIQPEGLQVGDILEFAVSITSRDPVMKGHVEQVTQGWNGITADRAHLRVQWPSTMNPRLRQVGALPALKPVKMGAITQAEWSLDNVEPVAPPRGAPARYAIGRMVEVTDFASWADLGALMAPLYQKAATLPAQGPLLTEIARIRDASADPKTRAEAALALVQDRVRYVALQMGAGGLVPADAETTWSRRFGDCKGKTALLLAILHSLGIEAEPVAVSTVAGDGMDERLPMIGLFNHVLVRATIAGKTYWLDGTRSGDTSLDRLKVPNFGWGLPLASSGAALVRIVPPPLTTPDVFTTIRMDASAGIGLPAPTRIETILTGDVAVFYNAMLGGLTGEARNRALREYWRGQHDFIDVDIATAIFDAKAGTLRMTMEGKARMDWESGWYETDGTSVGSKADFHRDAGRDQDAPFAVTPPYSTKTVEIIVLPPGFSPPAADSKAEVDQTVAGVEYRRHVQFANNTYTIERTERSVASEFPAKDAPAAQVILRELAGRTLYIRKPPGYQPSERELTASMEGAAPTTASGFIDRGNLFLDRSAFPIAIQNFDSALALEPKNAIALADRGITRVWMAEYDAAKRDLDAAAAIQPQNDIVFRARGLMAEKTGAWRDAVAAYTNAIELWASDSFALGHRAIAYRALGENDAALRDAAAAQKRNPKWVEMYLLRANLFRSQGKFEEGAAEAAALSAANPDDSYSHVAAANIYSGMHKTPEAMREYDKALAIRQDAYVYLNRALNRPHEDLAARRADIDAALKLQPSMPEALAAKARILSESGDRTGALAAYSAAITAEPNDPALLNGRGIVFARNGDMVRAGRDFAAARAKAVEAVTLNNICWAKATEGVALDAALEDCNAALLKSPDFAAYLDSRALVLLRMGRIDDAITDYSKALAKEPSMASSLYGRSVAWARKGDKAKSDMDYDAAMKVSPGVKEQYDRYGVTR